MLTCTKCGNTKPEAEFSTSPRAKSGRDTRCRDCRRSYATDYNNRHEVKDRLRVRLARLRAEGPKITLQTSLLRALKRRPTERPANISDLMAMWLAQDGRCAVSGLPMTWYRGKALPTSVSIDRIDNARGYSRDNVRLICYAINTFRGRWDDDHVLTMARAIVAHLDRRNEAKLYDLNAYRAEQLMIATAG